MNPFLREKIEVMVGPIQNITVLAEQGWTSEVCQIETEAGIYLMKSSYKEKYREWLKQEANVLEKLHNQNQIPVPAYYGFIEEQDGAHLIMSFEQGVTLRVALKQAETRAEQKALIKSFGHFLQQLHETKIIQTLDRHENWLEEQLAKAEGYVKRGQTDGSVELLEKLKNSKPFPVKQTIIHGDCTIDNVLVKDGEVKLFIDVAGMTVGDPRYDESLAIRKFVNDKEDMDAFYEGYTRYRVSKEELQYFDEGLYEFF
ncbi:phosphotransferase [Bacillus salitolerans]|uniref:Phosphotransferase n=1 Tax=Bacillus salitolerans TaxID=1437434 RepID=A0ABW4LYI5_9BACI